MANPEKKPCIIIIITAVVYDWGLICMPTSAALKCTQTSGRGSKISIWKGEVAGSIHRAEDFIVH